MTSEDSHLLCLKNVLCVVCYDIYLGDFNASFSKVPFHVPPPIQIIFKWESWMVDLDFWKTDYDFAKVKD